MKILVLAEKPSVARDFARVLNCGEKHKGFFEGPAYVITWALGHLVTLAEPHEYDARYREWKLEDLPMLPTEMRLQVLRESARQFALVRQLFQRGDLAELVVATDAGREGELVARWIMKLGGWKKPFRRLWISSQTDAAIRDGFRNLKPGKQYDHLFAAALCRAEADWLIGLNITRALTCKFDAQLTAGRVQTPTLALIVQREREIQSFTPKPFWTLRADFGDYRGVWRQAHGDSRFFDRDKAQALLAKVQGQSGRVVESRRETKLEPPPAAYDLTELQRDANRFFGYSAQKTLSVLQSLYEAHKLVTYPRTDSRYISADIVPTLPARLSALASGEYAALVAPLRQTPPRPGKHFVNDARVTDHHAIIPTEQPLAGAALDSDEKRIHDLVVRRFLAVLYPPCTVRETALVTEVQGERFHSRGRQVEDPGWRRVTTRGGRSEEEKEQDQGDVPVESDVPALEKGTVRAVRECRLEPGKTQPPARYTEATLLSAMENAGRFVDDEELRESLKKGGLGTPATRAEIIEKILAANYIERRGRELLPTGKGFQLIDLVPPALRSPDLTGQWELRLSEIAAGRERREDFMKAIRRNTEELVTAVKASAAEFRNDQLTRQKCPECGNFLQWVNGKKGKELACSNRRCQYRPAEREGGDPFDFSRGKRDRFRDRRLIEKYTDKDSGSVSLGDILEGALKKK